MFYGIYTNNSNIWAHGALVELGFEFVDLLCAILKYGDFSRPDVKSTYILFLYIHHLPGIILLIPVC